MAAFGLGLRHRRAPSFAIVAPLLAGIDSNGWSAQWLTGTPPVFTPDTAPQTIAVTRAGFDATGAATSYPEGRTVTLRMRQPAPTSASGSPVWTAAGVVLDDYVYASDNIAGVANNSAEASPKPVCQWVTPHRLPIGTTIGGATAPVELVAAHRDARSNREVAAVIFKVGDGTTTISVTVAATVVSGRTGDRFPVVVYQLPATDIGSLAAGLITVNAEVYPWIGAAASVANSASDGNAARGFAPRYFWKSAATPHLAYVSSAGSDTGGVASQTDATAAAAPCLTVNGALAKINAAAGKVDGATIYIVNTVALGGTAAANLTQNVGAVTITRAAGSTKAAAIVQHGVAWTPKLLTGIAAPTATGAIVFKDLTFQRTANVAINGAAGNQLELLFDGGVVFDGGGFNGTYLGNAHDYHFGTSFTNVTGASTLGAGTNEHRLWRGVGLNTGSTVTSMEGWAVFGCDVSGPVSFQGGTRSLSGALVGFSIFRNGPTAANQFEIALAADVSGYLHLQNVYEFTSTTTSSTVRVTGDSATGNVTHFGMHHCTFAGGFQCGRWNMLYDDGTTRRMTKLPSFIGNIAVAIYTKSDLFIAENNNGSASPGTAAAATGNWAFSMGVGCRGNFSQHKSASDLGGNEAQMYPGLAAKIGTSQAARQDPLLRPMAGRPTTASIPQARAAACIRSSRAARRGTWWRDPCSRMTSPAPRDRPPATAPVPMHDPTTSPMTTRAAAATPPSCPAPLCLS